MTIALRYAARSDVGLVRSNNQDSAYSGPHLLVVADGMGGHAGGDVASSVAVAHLAPLDEEAHGGDALDELENAIQAAHAELVARAAAEPELAGLGTTVTALLRSGNKLAMAHIGDSRAYLLRGGEFSQVTVDHSFVQHLVDTGRITQDEAEHHPQRSVLLRVLGDVGSDITVDLSVREARAGDRWLLCSDGLSGVVSGGTIAQTLADIADVGECADRLVQLALRGGGPDNVTCIVADVVELDDLPDGAAPPTHAQVVGAAAVTRGRPSAAGDGPAARAARLARPRSEHGGSDDDAEGDRGRSGLRRAFVTVAVVAVVLVLVGAVGAAGYRWTQDQYYVGVDGDAVAIYQGIPQSVGPVHLSHVVERTDVSVADLPDYWRQRLDSTIPADGLGDARERAQLLGEDARPTPTPSAVTPTASPAQPTEPGPGVDDAPAVAP